MAIKFIFNKFTTSLCNWPPFLQLRSGVKLFCLAGLLRSIPAAAYMSAPEYFIVMTACSHSRNKALSYRSYIHISFNHTNMVKALISKTIFGFNHFTNRTETFKILAFHT
uniref:Uncharacterized protein n=1 Tax=Sclerotinia borealis TaxID=77105 RepID=A0A088CS14_9HELO|nr:hypothetical protein SBORM_0133 [Sclerotinia borealis]AIJ56803.1 hypothetical protein SBORM_0133 [Sclerotinia borealis]